jgi:lipopolysaccharide biosynthesis glycosyltransferase
MTNVVYFIADRKFLPLALANAGVLARQAARNFDILIFYEDSEPIPFRVPAGVDVVTGALMPMVPDAAASNGLYPKIVWARVFAPYFLRGRYSRGLYGDADVSFFGPIDGLFELDLAGAPLAAVTDCIVHEPNERVVLAHIGAAGVRSGRYANSGVLLIDIPAWCSHDLSAALLAYCSSHASHLEQDFINYVFQDSWLELSPRWNFMANLIPFGIQHTLRPAIYHYITHRRPWNETDFPFEPIHRRYFEDAFAAIGAPSFLEGFGRRSPLFRKLAFAIKNGVYNASLFSGKKRTKYVKWAKRYKAFYLNLESALAAGCFIDVKQGLSTIDLPACRESPRLQETVYCRGHIIPAVARPIA